MTREKPNHHCVRVAEGLGSKTFISRCHSESSQGPVRIPDAGKDCRCASSYRAHAED